MDFNFDDDLNSITNLNKNSNTQYSWWLTKKSIIIAFIFFWPLGIFLFFKRLQVSDGSPLATGKIITRTGIGLTIFFMFGLFNAIFNNPTLENIRGLLFFVIGGIAVIVLGRFVTNKGKRTIKYFSIINSGMVDIDNVAASIPIAYEKAKKDVQKMIDTGYFPGAYINESERKIVFPSTAKATDTQKQTSATKVVVCSGCGARNTIPVNVVSECEYCGSKLQG